MPLYPQYAMASTKTVEVAVDSGAARARHPASVRPAVLRRPGISRRARGAHGRARPGRTRSTCSSATTASRSGICAKSIRRHALPELAGLLRDSVRGARDVLPPSGHRDDRRARAAPGPARRASTASRSSRVWAAAGCDRSPTSNWPSCRSAGSRGSRSCARRSSPIVSRRSKRSTCADARRSSDAGGTSFTYLPCLNDDPALDRGARRAVRRARARAVSTVAVVGGGNRRPGRGGAALRERTTSRSSSSAPVAGGKIRTQHVDGFVFDWGPNGFLSSAAELSRSCARPGSTAR